MVVGLRFVWVAATLVAPVAASASADVAVAARVLWRRWGMSSMPHRLCLHLLIRLRLHTRLHTLLHLWGSRSLPLLTHSLLVR